MSTGFIIWHLLMELVTFMKNQGHFRCRNSRALNTMDSAQKYGVSKYILASSSEVYNEPQKIPTDENERAIIPDVKNPRFSLWWGKLISTSLSII